VALVRERTIPTYVTKQLNTWNSVIEQLKSLQLVNKFSAFYATEYSPPCSQKPLLKEINQFFSNWIDIQYVIAVISIRC